MALAFGFLLWFCIYFRTFFFRSRKEFIAREFSWRKEKRKTAYWRMQGDQETETGDPLELFLFSSLKNSICIFIGIALNP
jgi:hypothetical protein